MNHILPLKHPYQINMQKKLEKITKQLLDTDYIISTTGLKYDKLFKDNELQITQFIFKIIQNYIKSPFVYEINKKSLIIKKIINDTLIPIEYQKILNIEYFYSLDKGNKNYQIKITNFPLSGSEKDNLIIFKICYNITKILNNKKPQIVNYTSKKNKKLEINSSKLKEKIQKLLKKRKDLIKQYNFLTQKYYSNLLKNSSIKVPSNIPYNLVVSNPKKPFDPPSLVIRNVKSISLINKKSKIKVIDNNFKEYLLDYFPLKNFISKYLSPFPFLINPSFYNYDASKNINIDLAPEE